MSTFRAIGGRVNYQGGASFSNLNLSNQFTTSRYAYSGITGNTGANYTVEVMRDELNTIVTETSVYLNISDAALSTVGSVLTTNLNFKNGIVEILYPSFVSQLQTVQTDASFVESVSVAEIPFVKVLVLDDVVFKTSVALNLQPFIQPILLNSSEFIGALQPVFGETIVTDSIQAVNPNSTVSLYETTTGTITIGNVGCTLNIEFSSIEVSYETGGYVNFSSVTAPTVATETENFAVATTAYVSSKLANAVTLAGTQAIYGVKRFLNGLAARRVVADDINSNASFFENMVGATVLSIGAHVSTVNVRGTLTFDANVSIFGNATFSGFFKTRTEPLGTSNSNVATTAFVSNEVDYSCVDTINAQSITGTKTFTGTVLVFKPYIIGESNSEVANVSFIRESVFEYMRKTETQTVSGIKFFVDGISITTPPLPTVEYRVPNTVVSTAYLQNKIDTDPCFTNALQTITGSKTFSGKIVFPYFKSINSTDDVTLFSTNTGEVGFGNNITLFKTPNDVVSARVDLPLQLYTSHTGQINLATEGTLIIPNTIRSFSASTDTNLYTTNVGAISIGNNAIPLFTMSSSLGLQVPNNIISSDLSSNINFCVTNTTGEIQIGSAALNTRLPNNIESAGLTGTLNLYTNTNLSQPINIGNANTLRVPNSIISYNTSADLSYYETHTGTINIGSNSSTTQINGDLNLALNKTIVYSLNDKSIPDNLAALGSNWTMTAFPDNLVLTKDASNNAIDVTICETEGNGTSIPYPFYGVYIITGNLNFFVDTSTITFLKKLVVKIGIPSDLNLYQFIHKSGINIDNDLRSLTVNFCFTIAHLLTDTNIRISCNGLVDTSTLKFNKNVSNVRLTRLA
jgi:hypothetical protein